MELPPLPKSGFSGAFVLGFSELPEWAREVLPNAALAASVGITAFPAWKLAFVAAFALPALWYGAVAAMESAIEIAVQEDGESSESPGPELRRAAVFALPAIGAAALACLA